MSRESKDQYDNTGLLVNGYDYINQAWVQDGVYQRCGHRPDTPCACYGRLHAGEPSKIRLERAFMRAGQQVAA
jgi:hypothetical protein